MPDKNFILCRNHPRKLLIPVIGQFHFMTEPTLLLLLPPAAAADPNPPPRPIGSFYHTTSKIGGSVGSVIKWISCSHL